jgi:hypothetical protein
MLRKNCNRWLLIVRMRIALKRLYSLFFQPASRIAYQPR